MKILSLHSVEGVAFGSAPTALAALGQPVRKSLNRSKEEEFHFPDIVYRFADQKLVEVCFRTPASIEIDGQAVESSSLATFLKKDSEYFEYVGFGIAPSMGLAYDFDHDGSWTVAFTKGRWDQFRKEPIQHATDNDGAAPRRV